MVAIPGKDVCCLRIHDSRNLGILQEIFNFLVVLCPKNRSRNFYHLPANQIIQFFASRKLGDPDLPRQNLKVPHRQAAIESINLVF